ncbi:MAG: hypothetical protein A2W93_03705 [Bacteroidetes bacterium GWF2_43_63]|nr:MAG: hypothetical protein A2W93_03705 [Bacteroidetes bacterium GWF2_43_63]HBG70534.1 hypothetical protein [Bacteroidales bacterium]HCB61530.1 hypothetical protein [Bacteroidales bacterium]
MKKYLYIHFALALLWLASCSPDNNMASRMDGVWNITKAEVSYFDSASNDFVLDTTYVNPGTVTLIDEGLNKKRDHYDLYCNPGNINLPGGTGSGDYYWSVDVGGTDNDVTRIEFMIDNYPWYYYFSYSVEWDGRRKMLWTTFDNTAAGLDNGNNKKEVWYLEKQ